MKTNVIESADRSAFPAKSVLVHLCESEDSRFLFFHRKNPMGSIRFVSGRDVNLYVKNPNVDKGDFSAFADAVVALRDWVWVNECDSIVLCRKEFYNFKMNWGLVSGIFKSVFKNMDITLSVIQNEI